MTTILNKSLSLSWDQSVHAPLSCSASTVHSAAPLLPFTQLLRFYRSLSCSASTVHSAAPLLPFTQLLRTVAPLSLQYWQAAIRLLSGRPFVASSGRGSFPLFQLCKVSGLGKILWYRYFARRCSQDIAYSHRFLELHGTPAHQSTWGISLSTWRQYDAALHACTSSTSTLLELNMLDDQDTADADQQELRNFLSLQQGEAVVAAKRKREHSPLPVAGPSSKKVWSDGSKKCSHRRTPVEEAAPESPRRVRLVVPPGRSMAASTSTAVPPSRNLPMQGPSNLVQLAAVAEAHSGLVR
ncbi:hypothetical protein F5876DRAFT_85027 [Lentinula aff. lateritia]|uniref:Uncharacterized protein n=1 Tax=Lentinula aff. lateritia TaxID=2804960 RepID=A0ACC1TFW7_9AGAR|nr:hypothetical protein F5876DRAFT_85027 [Lentinula aff. lateritia]